MRIALVSCVKRKQALAAPARDLYVSALFRSMRRFAQSNADRWFILSAEHGLVAPETVIEPYERTLNRMAAQERRVWAARVLESLDCEVSPGDSVVILAGARYREGIVRPLRERGINVELPLEGRRLGEQLQWLNSQVRDA